MTTNALEELLPCPFCGHPPDYTPPHVMCAVPYIACPTIFEDGHRCGAYAQSVERWNTRAVTAVKP
jgi:hypothetical protein